MARTTAGWLYPQCCWDFWCHLVCILAYAEVKQTDPQATPLVVYVAGRHHQVRVSCADPGCRQTHTQTAAPAH